MHLSPPFQISARLLPALVVCGATIQLEFSGRTSDNRIRFKWTIDLPDGSEHWASDLKSGCGTREIPAALQEGFGSLLSFLSACGASWSEVAADRGENADLFPEAVARWAELACDEIEMLRMEIAEGRPELLKP